jgi:hypothetical protein
MASSPNCLLYSICMQPRNEEYDCARQLRWEGKAYLKYIRGIISKQTLSRELSQLLFSEPPRYLAEIPCSLKDPTSVSTNPPRNTVHIMIRLGLSMHLLSHEDSLQRYGRNSAITLAIKILNLGDPTRSINLVHLLSSVHASNEDNEAIEECMNESMAESGMGKRVLVLRLVRRVVILVFFHRTFRHHYLNSPNVQEF